MMKKITLLLSAFLIGITLNAQVAYFSDNFVGGDMTQWTTIDSDGDGNNWAPATAASMNGECLNSDSWTSALGALDPDNFLVTAAPIVFPTVADLSLKFRVGTFQINGTFIADRYTVYLSATNTEAGILAGTVLYNGLLSDVMTADVADGSASFFIHEFDMSAYQGQTLYLTFRHHNCPDENSVLLNSILLSSPFADDLKLDAVVSPKTQGAGCQLGIETVTASITNNGLNPVTTFDATYVITNFLSGNVVDSVTETITVPSLALDATTEFSFTTQTSDLAATDSIYFLDVFVSMPADQDLSSDTAFSFISSIATQTIPYVCSFERINAAGTAVPEIDAWGWADEDMNGNGSSFTPTLFGAGTGLTNNGDNALFVDEGNTDWAFSPCLATTIGTAYRAKFFVRTGEFTDGSAVPEIIEVGFGTGANAAAMTIIRLDSLNDNSTFTEFAYDFVATAATTNIGIHKVSSFFIVSVDDFSIEELPAPTASISSSTVDPCTGNASVAFALETGNTYTINWGDGTTDTATSSPATHTYTATGTQNITLTATNLSGSGSANTSVNNTLAAPVAAFTYNQSGTADLTVSFTAGNVQSCNTYAWDFGDGQTSTGPSTNNIYAAVAGTYTVTLTVTNSAGSNSTTQELVITTNVGINTLDFANGVSVFPNPVQDELNIAFDLNSKQDVAIALVTVDGKVVKTNTISNATNVNTTINVNDLSTGLYILSITTADGKFTKNVMVK